MGPDKGGFRYFLSAGIFIFIPMFLGAVTLEQEYLFRDPKIIHSGEYQKITFDHTILSGLPGEPVLPYHQVVLMIPPGERAVAIEFSWEDECLIPGRFLLFPRQYVIPVSDTSRVEFIKNEQVYTRDETYPDRPVGRMITQHLNGYSFALCSFTPVRYIPASGTLSYFRMVTVRILTEADQRQQAVIPHDGSPYARSRAMTFAHNPEMISGYPKTDAPITGYDILIISPPSFQDEFMSLEAFYASKGMDSQVITTDSIYAAMTGWDNPEKIRNFIIQEYQNHGIEYVLLAGNPPLTPYRGFYCQVESGGFITDSNIPADLYFSGLDGTYDADTDHIYAEVNDDPDLLPDVAVARLTVNDTAELRNLIHKTIAYQTNPVLGELTHPLFAGEYLYHNPITFGGPYMNLLIDDHNDNGYFTHGIPSALNVTDTLYDTLISASPLSYWSWNLAMLTSWINQGRSFIHHLGHSSYTYMLRMNSSYITNANFSQVNGINHNYTFIYTQGCQCGGFDQAGGCIAAKAVSIDNFLVGGVFNSRYGWFNQGTTDGPSEHLEREFVNAIYTDTLPDNHLGGAHMNSKIKTAPWVTMPGEFEPGAQRWCHYCSNAFGDPSLEIWTEEPSSFTTLIWTGSISADWSDPGNWNPAIAPTSLYDVVIPDSPVKPSVSADTPSTCHDLIILTGGDLTIQPGKSLIVYGELLLGEP
jgi:hypothetical protein